MAIGPLENITALQAATDARDSSAEVSGKITSTPAGLVGVVWSTKTKEISADIAVSRNASEQE